MNVAGDDEWRTWYEASSQKLNERENVGQMLRKLDVRRFWYSVFMVTSGLFVVGMTTVFYNVLSR
jgi:hypothetical protein